jgi:hypothetical protein
MYLGDKMDFADHIKELVALLEKNKDSVFTEEATKHSLVMPFLQVLGYDVFNPTEVIPEFTADIGIKKGEKVDYAIAIDNEIKILIEVKAVRTILHPKASGQLLRYFGVTKAIFAILTNGIEYQFFSDLEQKNIMDTTPFLIVNLVSSIRDSEISQLRKFHKTYFDADKILSSAIELKYTGEIKKYIKEQVKEPDEEFIKFFMKKTSLSGFITKHSASRYAPIVVNAFRQYVTESVSNTLQEAIKETTKSETVANGHLSEREKILLRFWTQLLVYSKTKTNLLAKLSPVKYDWIGKGAGFGGLSYCLSIAKNEAMVDLYIDKGKNSKDNNKQIFDTLASSKAEIENIFGEPLGWKRINEKRACRIKKEITLGGYLNEQNWPKLQEIMVDSLIRFEKAFTPFIQKLRK